MIPSAIQFSGGRTSGYMLHELLKLPSIKYQMQNGLLSIDFENTGKEREETLEFIAEIEDRWKVPIVWLEFDDAFDILEYQKPDGTFRTRKQRKGVRYKVVNFATASRNGEPFQKLLKMTGDFRQAVKDMPRILPNPVMRFCTGFMKRKVCRTHLFDLGWTEWDIYMGIRADEAHRRHKMLEWLPGNESLQTPLIDDGITKQDVGEFWSHQPFDLRLDPNSDEGNCDLCFLKATGKLIQIIKKRPESVEWWKQQETISGQTFSRTKLSFHQLDEMIKRNDPRLLKYINNQADKTVDCFCGE